MAQPIFSAESYHIYDPYFGFYVKKLTEDSTTPFLKKKRMEQYGRRFTRFLNSVHTNN